MQPIKMDVRDWLVGISMVVIHFIATVFLFQHPEAMNFATWAAVTGSVTSAYHWTSMKDDKTPDAHVDSYEGR